MTVEPRRAASARKSVSFEEAMLARAGAGRGAPATLYIEWLSQLSSLLVAESTNCAQMTMLRDFERCSLSGFLLAGDVALLSLEVRDWRDDTVTMSGAILCKEKQILQIEGAIFGLVPAEKLCDIEELRAMLRAAHGEFPRPVGFRS